MSKKHGIGYIKDTHQNIETDCYTCLHRRVCFRLKAIEELKLPLPIEMTFVCRQFKREEPSGEDKEYSLGRSHEECDDCVLKDIEPQQCKGHQPGPVSCRQFKQRIWQ